MAERRTKRQTIDKILHRETKTPLNSGATEAFPASQVAPVMLLLLKNDERGKGGIVITTKGTYPWLFVTYSVTVDQVMVAKVTLSNSRLQLYHSETLVSIAALLAATLSYGNHIGATRSGTSYQLREIYSIRRRCWNVATYTRKYQDGKIGIIVFVVRLRS